jgi:hypothetical protein
VIFATSGAFDAEQVVLSRTRARIVLISGFHVHLIAQSKGVVVVNSRLKSQRAQPALLASQQITMQNRIHLEGGHDQRL